jgi:hypothetical protein
MAIRTRNKEFRSLLSLLRGKKAAARAAQAVLAVLLLLAALFHLRAGFLAQLAMTGSPQAAGFSSCLAQPDALARMARKEHLTMGRLEEASRMYRRGLENLVLHVPSWLGLIEIYNDLGRNDRAAAALRFVDDFAAKRESTAWSMALLAHQLDLEDILVRNLEWLAASQPRKLAEILPLAELRWQEPAEIMRRFDPVHYPGILHYYTRQKNPAGAAAAWTATRETVNIPADTVLAYVNFLLQQGEVAEAAAIWKNNYLEGEGLLFNPALREPFLGSGFAWRVSRPESVTLQPLAGEEGMQIIFDGTENAAFQLRQIVPLAPGDYVFRGWISARDLTTDQHPFWTVSGYRCDGLNVTGPMLPSTTEPREFTLPFSVPDSCRAVLITLRRNTSYFFDNKIAGTVEVSGLQLAPQILTADETPPQDFPASAFPGKPDRNTDIKINKIIIQSDYNSGAL